MSEITRIGSVAGHSVSTLAVFMEILSGFRPRQLHIGLNLGANPCELGHFAGDAP